MENIKRQKDGRSFKGEPFCKRGHPKEFGKDCRECNRIRGLEWQEKNREFAKTRALQYHADHREEQNAKMRAYGKKNRPKLLAKQKEWKLANRDRVNEWNREHYKKTRAEHAAFVRSWKERNKETWREINNAAKNRRRARIAGSIGTHTRAEWNAILAKQKGRCAMCGLKRKLEKEHIVPISLGGSNMAVNLQGACRPCNNAKYTSIAEGTQLGIFDRLAAHLGK